MAIEATPPSGRAFSLSDLTRWHRHLLQLGFAVVLLLVVGAGDLADMVAAWARTGAFHHIFLVGPIIAWLVWQRRATLAQMTPEFAPVGCLLVGVGMLLWLMGAAGFVSILRQAGVVLAAQGLVVALLGMPVARALAFPLGFALFLLPIGSELEPQLQLVTAHTALWLLHLSGTAAQMEGVFIATPAGLFRVAEACSGTGFLLAMAAFAALVCLLCFRSPFRRTLFVVAAMLLAVLANGVRAYAIMEIASRTSMANPIVRDHVLYGWLLFAALLVLLMWGASRWFDRTPDDATVSAAALQGIARPEGQGRWVAPLLALLLLAPLLWTGATAAPPARVPPPPVAPAVPGWTLLAEGAPFDWRPDFPSATWIGHWLYRDASGARIDFVIVLFERQEEGRELVGYGAGAPVSDRRGRWELASREAAPAGGQADWLRYGSGRMRYVARWYLVDGSTTGDAMLAKLAAIRGRLLHGRHGGAALFLSASEGSAPDPHGAVSAFLNAAGPIGGLAARSAPGF